MSYNNKANEIKKQFESFFESRTEEQKIKHDEDMLMAAFLSEIERVQKQKDINRKKLSELIQTSGSYLTQVFRGDKPLNFHTIAKMQRVLNIRFVIQAQHKNSIVDNIFNCEGRPSENIFQFNNSNVFSYASLMTETKTTTHRMEASSMQHLDN